MDLVKRISLKNHADVMESLILQELQIISRYIYYPLVRVVSLLKNKYALKIKSYPNANLSIQNGQETGGVGKRRRKRQSSDVCNNMQARCRDCRGDTARTAYVEKTDFDKYC